MLGGCDIRVACPEAKFAVMEPKRGLFAGGGTTVRLPRQIPWPQAMEFLLCADLDPGRARATRWACSTRSSRATQLLDTAREYARAHRSRTRRSRCRRRSRARCRASTSTKTLTTQLRDARVQRAARRVVADRRRSRCRGRRRARRSSARSCARRSRRRAQLSSAIFQTEDAKEGPKAFAEKRPPVWQARVSDDRSAHAVHHRGRARTRGIPTTSATRARPSRSTCGSTSRAPRPPTRRGAGVARPRSTASRSCTARRGSTTTPSHGSPNGSAPTRSTGYYSGIGGTTTQQLVNATATRMLARRARPRARSRARRRSRRSRRTRSAASATPYSFKPDREAAVPVGGAARSGRGRARGVPGLADVRGVRQRAARRTSASGSTSTAPASARCWRR